MDRREYKKYSKKSSYKITIVEHCSCHAAVYGMNNT
jgi:hypothetical protein